MRPSASHRLSSAPVTPSARQITASLRRTNSAAPAAATLRPPSQGSLQGAAARVAARRAPRPAAVSTTASAAAAAAAAPAATMTAWTIVGGGRVGEALAAMGGGADAVVRRGQTVADAGLGAGPIVVATRNDALADVVDGTPPARRRDLVFIQNGMLQPWLDARGLGDATQVLVYFAVAKAGDAPTDGVTDVNPEGLTAACGPWAGEVAARLRAAGLSCKVLPPPEFQKSMLEKLIWICAFMLVGARAGGITVGEVEARHRAEVGALIAELGAAGGAALGVALDAGLEEQLCAYARSVAHFPTAVKELPWRNGWFLGLSADAAARGRPDPCPTHSAWCAEVGAAL